MVAADGKDLDQLILKRMTLEFVWVHLEFYCPVNIVKVMSCKSVNLQQAESSMPINSTCEHTFASNWQLPILNQQKGENDCRNDFLINIHKSKLVKPGFELGSAVRHATDCAMEPGRDDPWNLRKRWEGVLIYRYGKCAKILYTKVSVCLFVLGFYGPVNPMGSYRAWSVYLTTRLLGRLSPLSG